MPVCGPASDSVSGASGSIQPCGIACAADSVLARPPAVHPVWVQSQKSILSGHNWPMLPLALAPATASAGRKHRLAIVIARCCHAPTPAHLPGSRRLAPCGRGLVKLRCNAAYTDSFRKQLRASGGLLRHSLAMRQNFLLIKPSIPGKHTSEVRLPARVLHSLSWSLLPLGWLTLSSCPQLVCGASPMP